MCTLGTSWNFFLRYAITLVTRENGSRRDPYPPTTVSLLTNPRLDFRSARTTRIASPQSHQLDPPRLSPRPAPATTGAACTGYEMSVKKPGDREETDVKECAEWGVQCKRKREYQAVAARA